MESTNEVIWDAIRFFQSLKKTSTRKYNKINQSEKIELRSSAGYYSRIPLEILNREFD